MSNFDTVLLVLIIIVMFYVVWQHRQPDVQAMELTQKLNKQNNDLFQQMARMSRHMAHLQFSLSEAKFVIREFLSALATHPDFDIAKFSARAQNWIANEQKNGGKWPAEAIINTAKLRRLMVEYFEVEEMKTLAYDLEIDFSGFGGKKDAFARDLIEATDNRGLLGELLLDLQEARHRVAWDVYDDDPAL